MKTKSEEMKGKIGEIEKVMKDNPHLRNNDRYLCAKIWQIEIKPYPKSISYFIKYYGAGIFTSADSITRLARMIRTKHNWKKDKRKEEAKVKKFVSKVNPKHFAKQKFA